MKTVKEVEKLKLSWYLDPCWDLADTEGFEEYREDLENYQRECEAKCESDSRMRENSLDEEAEKLGIKGLYRLIKKHENLLERHRSAIIELSNGNSNRAYNILQGYND